MSSRASKRRHLVFKHERNDQTEWRRVLSSMSIAYLKHDDAWRVISSLLGVPGRAALEAAHALGGADAILAMVRTRAAKLWPDGPPWTSGAWPEGHIDIELPDLTELKAHAAKHR